VLCSSLCCRFGASQLRFLPKCTQCVRIKGAIWHQRVRQLELLEPFRERLQVLDGGTWRWLRLTPCGSCQECLSVSEEREQTLPCFDRQQARGRQFARSIGLVVAEHLEFRHEQRALSLGALGCIVLVLELLLNDDGSNLSVRGIAAGWLE